jgi:uncharacterized protein YdaU (DUF1376 family)
MMKNPWYKYYEERFTRGTLQMTCVQVGAYQRLLNAQFDRGLIPKDMKLLRIITGTTEKNIRAVLVKFDEFDDGYRHHFMAEVVEDQGAFSNRQKKNGSKGGRPKKNPRDNFGLTQTEPTSKPTQNQEEEEEDKEEEKDSGFVLKGCLADMFADWKAGDPQYPFEARNDLPALQEIGRRISLAQGWTSASTFTTNFPAVRKKWKEYCAFIRASTFYGKMTLPDIEKFLQKIIHESRTIKPKQNVTGYQPTAQEQEGKRIRDEVERVRNLRKNPPAG